MAVSRQHHHKRLILALTLILAIVPAFVATPAGRHISQGLTARFMQVKPSSNGLAQINFDKPKESTLEGASQVGDSSQRAISVQAAAQSTTE